MKKRNIIFILSLFLIIFVISCSTQTNINVNTENIEVKENLNNEAKYDIKREQIVRELEIDAKGTKFKIKETERFVFCYPEEDESAIDSLLKVLDDNYERIVNDLKPDKIPKTIIIVYPTLETFHNAIGRPNANDTFTGLTNGTNSIRIVSPKSPGPRHSYKSIHGTLLHEFAHVVENNISMYTPTWLSESIAQYESNRFKDPSKLSYMNSGNYIKFLEMTSPAGNQEIYDIGYTIIEYIVENWGMETVRELVVHYGNVEKVLNISPEEFQEGWYKFIDKKYLH